MSIPEVKILYKYKHVMVSFPFPETSQWLQHPTHIDISWEFPLASELSGFLYTVTPRGTCRFSMVNFLCLRDQLGSFPLNMLLVRVEVLYKYRFQ